MNCIDFLKEKGIDFKVLTFGKKLRTSKDVVEAYDCSLGEVLKTLAFIGDIQPVIAVLPGNKRVSIEKLKQISSQDFLRLATKREVEEITDYEAGGVSPFGIEKGFQVMDKSAFDLNEANMGGGKPELGIEMSIDELKKAWEGGVDNILE